MDYDDPAHREMMDLEGLKAWLPGPHHRLRATLAAAVRGAALLRGGTPTA